MKEKQLGKVNDWNDLAEVSSAQEVEQRILADLDRLAEFNAAYDSAPASAADEEPPPHDGPPDPPPADPDLAFIQALHRTKDGGFKAHVANLKAILSWDPRWHGRLRYCEFSYRVLKAAPPPWRHGMAGEWEDPDTARLRDWFIRNYAINPSRTDAQDAIVVVAQEHRVHPVREHIRALTHDGEQRLETWLEDALGASGDKRYLSLVGRKFLIGAVARIFRPGCKMDTVLILEGEQGIGKSSALEAIFEPWFSDSPIPIGEKDAYQNIMGVWGQELAELDSFSKAESTTSKAFFSQRRVRYRPSYGHAAQDFPLQTVYCASTNQSEYLKDYSGNRRYWPVFVTEVNLDYLRANRDQLLAEAFAEFQAGTPWWLLAEEKALFEQEQESRLQRDPWEEIVLNWLESHTRVFVTAEEIFTEAFGFDQAYAIQRAHQMRLSPILKALGWKHVKRRHSGRQRWGYERPRDPADIPMPSDG